MYNNLNMYTLIKCFVCNNYIITYTATHLKSKRFQRILFFRIHHLLKKSDCLFLRSIKMFQQIKKLQFMNRSFSSFKFYIAKLIFRCSLFQLLYVLLPINLIGKLLLKHGHINRILGDLFRPKSYDRGLDELRHSNHSRLKL